MDTRGERRQRILLAVLGIPCVIALLGIPLGYYARYRWREAQFDRMSEEARAFGGHSNITGRVSLFWGIEVWCDSCIEDIELSSTAVTDADLLSWPISGSKELDEIILSDTKISDAGLEVFRGLRCVKYLDVSNTKVTRKGLDVIQTLSGLETLYLDGLQIQNQDLQSLCAIKSLKELHLSNTRIDGRGLAHLASLTQLECLHLNRTNVTNADLLQLKGLKELRELWLQETQVTLSIYDQLKSELPYCSFIIDQRSVEP